jgi:hypothetical protein
MMGLINFMPCSPWVTDMIVEMFPDYLLVKTNPTSSLENIFLATGEVILYPIFFVTFDHEKPSEDLFIFTPDEPLDIVAIYHIYSSSRYQTAGPLPHVMMKPVPLGMTTQYC